MPNVPFFVASISAAMSPYNEALSWLAVLDLPTGLAFACRSSAGVATGGSCSGYMDKPHWPCDSGWRWTSSQGGPKENSVTESWERNDHVMNLAGECLPLSCMQ